MSIMFNEIMEQPGVLLGIEEKNKDVLTELVAAIKQADIRQVVIAARGTSDHCGIYIKYLAEILLGMPVMLAAPSVNTLYNAKVLYRDAVVIAISQSGMAQDALAVLEDANECNSITVAVTNNPQSPVAKTARFHLDCVAGPEKSVAATKTFTAEMYCLALLVARWGANEELLHALRELPQGIERELAHAQEIMHSARSFTFMQQCFVLGRGLLYPIVLEASLKMMETSYTNARGFAISDFQHGPLALVTDNTPIFVYCVSDETREDVLKAAGQYADLGAYVILVTDDQRNTDNAEKVFMVEKSNKYTAPFHFVVFAQLFACGLADAKRRTPDAPRNIKKITITK
ncbi:MAG: SIS domain-containing protein [Eubacteriales bacterium]